LNVSATFSTAFQKLDHEFRELVARPRGLQDGSTALVAGLYHRKDAAEGEPPFQLVVGNLGDCRAVLIQPSREDVPVHNVDEEAALLPAPSAAPAPSNVLALSTDHKPDLPAERAYVESLPGGFVTRARPGRSLARVQGVLAVSRAIGDASLKPWVRSEPDVRIIELEDSDAPAFAAAQCAPEEHRSVPSCSASNSISSVGVTTPLLLLASDGFWDVFDNTEAGQFALDFLHERAMQQMSSASSSSSSSSPSDTSTAAGDNPPAAAPTAVPVLSALAQHLVTEAYLRGSFDNISVMTIDVACIQRWLKQQQQRSQSVATPQAAPI
jgi:serine/threonine protein phosphatase PrpC